MNLRAQQRLGASKLLTGSGFTRQAKNGTSFRPSQSRCRANRSPIYFPKTLTDRGEGTTVSNDDGKKQSEQSMQSIKHQLSIWWGKLLYSYFNWRKDTWNDLQLITLLNLVLLCIGAACRHTLHVAFAEDAPVEGINAAWHNMYEILVVVFGQDLPDIAASGTAQLFSIIVAAVGLGSFALVLALVEQVVLQVLDTNVRQGGKAFESGHTLVLSLADSQRDQEVIWKILSQACLAHRGESEPHTVVVLCQREKLFMEAVFRKSLPEEKRHGCRFVFRQGLPLIPDSLRQVSASQAASTIVISDSSRSPEEADAQAIRVAILLDELDFPGYGKPDPRTGHIIVELKTDDAKQMIEYSCSKRVIALPTGLYNAKRIAMMVSTPVVGMVSQQLWSFHSSSQCYLQPAGELAGRRLSEIHRRFTRGLVLGVYDTKTKKTTLNPAVSRKLKSRDMLVMMRPTSVGKNEYRAHSQPVEVDLGDWCPTDYVHNVEEEPVTVMKSREDADQRLAGFSAKSCSPQRRGKLPPNCTGLYMLPLEYTTSSKEAEKVLICGWGNSIFMLDLLKSLDETLPPGSEVTLFNMRVNEAVISAVRSEAELKSVEVMGVRGDPLKITQLRRRVDVTEYKCAIVLCDQSWQDPDLDLTNGLDLLSEADTLRLDALVMTVQLNIRKLLEEAGFPDINLLAEKIAFEGVTRFEDRTRLPMGISVNLTAYAAKLCFQAAYNPMILDPYMAFGHSAELLVQDSSAFCAPGEEINFWQLQGRCLSVGQTLIGSYEIPKTVDSPLSLAVNPWGLEERNRKFAWNKADGRRKILTLVDRQSSLERHSGSGVKPSLNSLKNLIAKVSPPVKIEVGHLSLEAEPSDSSKNGSGLVWVPQPSNATASSDSESGGTGVHWTVTEQLDDVWKSSGQDANGRLLDDLASKEDYTMKFKAQQDAARQN